MSFRKVLLFWLAVFIVIIFFSIPVYKNWLTDKVINAADYEWQLSHQSTEDRMLNRFGNDYAMYHAIAQKLKTLPVHDSFILVPPLPYIKAMKVPGWPENIEPEVFYYFTGFKSVDINSPKINSANWAVVLEGHRVSLKRISDPQVFEQTLTEFKKYK